MDRISKSIKLRVYSTDVMPKDGDEGPDSVQLGVSPHVTTSKKHDGGFANLDDLFSNNGQMFYDGFAATEEGSNEIPEDFTGVHFLSEEGRVFSFYHG